jgi:hypothetical protein
MNHKYYLDTEGFGREHLEETIKSLGLQLVPPVTISINEVAQILDLSEAYRKAKHDRNFLIIDYDTMLIRTEKKAKALDKQQTT